MSLAPLSPRLERLATWLGHRWCGLTTGHAYIRHPDPWRLLFVCWDCGHTYGWEVRETAAPRPSRQKGGSQ